MMTISKKIFLILALMLVTVGYVFQQAHNIISNNDTYNYILSGLYGIDSVRYEEILNLFIDSCPNPSCQAYELSTIGPRYYYNYPIFGLLIQAFNYLHIPSTTAIIVSIAVTYFFIYYKIFRSINDEILNVNLVPLFFGFFNPALVFIRCLMGINKKSILPILIICGCTFFYYKNFGYSLSIVRYVSIYWALYIYSKYINDQKIVFSDFVMLYTHLLVGLLVSIMILIAIVDFSTIRDRFKGGMRWLFVVVIFLVCFMGAFFSNPAFPFGNVNQRLLVICVALISIYVALFIAAKIKRRMENFSFESSKFLLKLFGMFCLLGLTYFVDKSNYQHKIFLLDYFLIPVTYMTLGFIAIHQEVTVSSIVLDKILMSLEKYRLAIIIFLCILISAKVLINFEKKITEPLNLYISSFEYDEKNLHELDAGMIRRLLFVRSVYDR